MLVSLRYCNMEGHEVLTALVKIRNAYVDFVAACHGRRRQGSQSRR